MALTLECLGYKSAASLGITGGFSVCDASPVLDVADSDGTAKQKIEVPDPSWGRHETVQLCRCWSISSLWYSALS